MPIRPVDIIKSQEASQLKHIDNKRAQSEQAHISKNFQNMVNQEHTKPNQVSKSENKEYRYDAKEKGNNSYSGSGGKKKEQEENKKESKEPIKPGGFDMLI